MEGCSVGATTLKAQFLYHSDEMVCARCHLLIAMIGWVYKGWDNLFWYPVYRALFITTPCPVEYCTITFLSSCICSELSLWPWMAAHCLPSFELLLLTYLQLAAGLGFQSFLLLGCLVYCFVPYLPRSTLLPFPQWCTWAWEDHTSRWGRKGKVPFAVEAKVLLLNGVWVALLPGARPSWVTSMPYMENTWRSLKYPGDCTLLRVLGIVPLCRVNYSSHNTLGEARSLLLPT